MYKDNDYMRAPAIGCCDPQGNYGCGVMMGSTWGVSDKPLAMVYAPLQVFGELYDKEAALVKGTLFKELDLPFVGCKGNGGCNTYPETWRGNAPSCNMSRDVRRGGIKNG